MAATLCAPASASASETTAQYASIIHNYNPRLLQAQTLNLALDVIRDAQRVHIDARLLMALVTVESHWRPSAISRTGARGLGQLMPRTAHSLRVDARDPSQNLRGTSTYLAGLLRQFGRQGESLHLAVAAYNAGPNAVKRAQGIPNNGETPTYVRRVISLWHALRERVGDAAARVLPGAYLIGTTPAAPPVETFSLDETQAAQPADTAP